MRYHSSRDGMYCKSRPLVRMMRLKRLENQFHRQLDLTRAPEISGRRARSSCDHAQGCRSSGEDGVEEVWMINQIGGIRPDFEIEALADLCGFGEVEVDIGDPRTDDRVPAQISKR